MLKHLLILLLLPSFAISQEIGTNVIVITNGQTEKENYVNFLKTLMSEGYDIDEKDDLFHTVLFKPKTYEYKYKRRMLVNYLIISADFKGDTIFVSAKNKAPGRIKRETVYDPDVPETVVAFDIMLNVCKNMGGSVSYRINPNHRRSRPNYYDDVYGR